MMNLKYELDFSEVKDISDEDMVKALTYSDSGPDPIPTSSEVVVPHDPCVVIRDGFVIIDGDCDESGIGSCTVKVAATKVKELYRFQVTYSPARATSEKVEVGLEHFRKNGIKVTPWID